MSAPEIDLAAIRARVAAAGVMELRAMVSALCDEVERLTHERDAYCRAKAENDERFMRERDEARAEVERLLAENARLTRACIEGLPREVIVCPSCGSRHIEGPRHDDPSINGAIRPHHHHRCYVCNHDWDAGRWSYGAESASVAVPVSVHESTVDMLAAEMRNLCEVRDALRDALRAYNKHITTELDDARNVALGAVEDAAKLREIIAGRTTAPTDAEIEAHEAAGGSWLMHVYEADPRLLLSGALAITWRDRMDGLDITIRWWPLDASGAPCAWPVVTTDGV